MAVLPVYNCFHPVLRQSTEPIKEFDQELIDLVDNMYDTMYNIPNGVGLAGNQVGEKKSVVVIDTSIGQENAKPNPITLINPEILELSDDEEEMQEGCLSIPEFYENVWRPIGVKVKYFDIDMKEHIIENDEFLARVIQHEVDHLHGKLIFDYISPLRKALTKSKLRKIEKGQIDINYKMILPDGSLYTPENSN